MEKTNFGMLGLGERGISGPLIAPSSYFMKTPPKQFRDNIARDMTEAFIRGDETK